MEQGRSELGPEGQAHLAVGTTKFSSGDGRRSLGFRIHCPRGAPWRASNVQLEVQLCFLPAHEIPPEHVHK